MASKTTATISARVPNEVKGMWDNALKGGNSAIRDIMIDIADKLHKGEIEFTDGKVIIPEPFVEEKTDYDMNNLIEACDNKGIKVQDAINKAAQMVWRG